MFAEGWGVEKGEVEAYKWLLLAAAQGSQKAAMNLEVLKTEILTPEQRAKVQLRADNIPAR